MKCDLRSVKVNAANGEETYVQCLRDRVQIYPSRNWGRLGLCLPCLEFVREHEQPSNTAVDKKEGAVVQFKDGAKGRKAPVTTLRLRRGILVCDKLPKAKKAAS